LRDRRDDIPLLIETFMTRSAELAGLPPRQLSDDGMAALQAYDWPGNVRQLRNVIDWILIMAPGDSGDPVNVDMLPPDIGAIAPMSRDQSATEIMTLPLREAREVFERQYLEAQINRFGGNISRTASFVGMDVFRCQILRRHTRFKLINLRGAGRCSSDLRSRLLRLCSESGDHQQQQYLSENRLHARYSVTLTVLCATPMRRFRSTIHFDTMSSSPAIS
jgi:hypothetical protein